MPRYLKWEEINPMFKKRTSMRNNFLNFSCLVVNLTLLSFFFNECDFASLSNIEGVNNNNESILNDHVSPKDLVKADLSTSSVSSSSLNNQDINEIDSNGQTRLIRMIRNHNTTLSLELIKAGADIYIIDKKNHNVLYYAILFRNMKVIVSLLENGMNINQIYTSNFTTILMHSIFVEFDELAKCLVEKGADLNLLNDYGMSALDYAIHKCNLNLVELLIKNGSKLKLNLSRNENSLSRLIANRRIDIIELLIKELDFDLNIHDNDGNTCLHHAARTGNAFMVVYLLQKKVNLNATNNFGRTSLDLAILEKKFNITKRLIEIGASISLSLIQDYVVEYWKSDECWSLIINLIDQKSADPEKRTILCRAIDENYMKLASDLINMGVNLNATDVYDHNILHHAIKSGNLEIMRALLEKGVDIKYGVPFRLVISLDNTHMMQLFIDIDLTIVHEKNIDSRRPIIEAIFCGSHNALQLLLENGADPNETFDDSSALDLILERVDYPNLFEMASILIEQGAKISNSNFDVIKAKSKFNSCWKEFLL